MIPFLGFIGTRSSSQSRPKEGIQGVLPTEVLNPSSRALGDRFGLSGSECQISRAFRKPSKEWDRERLRARAPGTLRSNH